MNLYGASSINLDNLRGRTLKNYIKIVLALYIIILMVSLQLPERITKNNLSKDTPLNDEIMII